MSSLGSTAIRSTTTRNSIATSTTRWSVLFELVVTTWNKVPCTYKISSLPNRFTRRTAAHNLVAHCDRNDNNQCGSTACRIFGRLFSLDTETISVMRSEEQILIGAFSFVKIDVRNHCHRCSQPAKSLAAHSSERDERIEYVETCLTRCVALRMG